MPIYEFICERCAGRFEALCRMGSNGEGMECPTCGCPKVRKAMSTFAARSASKGGGASVPVGGSSCSSCAGGHCSTCH